MRCAIRIVLPILAALIGSAPAAQAPDEQTRQIVAEEFLKARPAATKPAPRQNPRYRPANPSGSTGSTPSVVALGLTLWKLRAAERSDDGARLLVQEGGAGALTAERIETGAPLAIGDRVRLSIESPSAGLLYVIDRELYSDGTKGDPYLIFPTKRTRQGDNAVKPGRLIDIPDQQDRPNYLTVRPSRAGQSGELLTIIVAPRPLDGVPIGDNALELPRDLVEGWEKSWSVPVQQFVQDGGRKTWTRQEQTAAADRTRLLTQDDPAPQTVYRVAPRTGAPVLVNVTLPYAASDR